MSILSGDDKARNVEDQANEKDVLLSIYDDAVEIDSSSGCVMSIDIKSKYFTLVLRTLFHDHYPSHQPPIFTIIPVSNAMDFPINIGKLEKECEETFVQGECVIYEWVVYLHEYLDTLDNFVDENKSVEAAEPLPVPVEDDEICAGVEELELEEHFTLEELQAKFEYNKNWNTEQLDESPTTEIYTGEILTERKSHFQAHVCRIKGKADIDRALETLLQNSKIAGASHNILAYRYTNESGTITTDYDDDGEAKAGGRLLEMLDLMKVEDMLVVVSRWYGGVLLGPARFKCINNIAHDTIVASGFYSTEHKKGKNKKNSKK